MSGIIWALGVATDVWEQPPLDFEPVTEFKENAVVLRNSQNITAALTGQRDMSSSTQPKPIYISCSQSDEESKIEVTTGAVIYMVKQGTKVIFIANGWATGTAVDPVKLKKRLLRHFKEDQILEKPDFVSKISPYDVKIYLIPNFNQLQGFEVQNLIQIGISTVSKPIRKVFSSHT